jgi:hypothetical protein
VEEREFLALELLDEVRVSVLAEYLARRLELDEGETMLQLEFKRGRYQRLQRLVKAPAKTSTDR